MKHFFNPIIKLDYTNLLAKIFTNKKILIITRNRPWYTIRAQAEDRGYEFIKTYKNGKKFVH